MGKHFEEKYKKTKKNELKILLIMVLILICIVMFGLYWSKNFNKDEVEIRNLINETFSSLKIVNIVEVNKYLEYNELVSSLDRMILEQNNENVSNLEKQLFNSMEWKINSIKMQENDILVNIEMKNKDFKEILTNWMKQIVNEKENNSSITPEIALEILENIVSENEIKKTVTKDIILEKQNDNFKIVVDDELRNLIFSGIESVATVVNEK